MREGGEGSLSQLMAGSAAGLLAVAWLPTMGVPPWPGPQPRGAGEPWAGCPGLLLRAQQPGGACLRLPAAQHRRHPARMYGHHLPAARAHLLLEWRERIEWGSRSKARRSRGVRGREEWSNRHGVKHGGDPGKHARKERRGGRELSREMAETATKRMGREGTGLPGEGQREQERHMLTLRPPWPSPRFCPTPDPSLANGAPALGEGGHGGQGRGARCPGPSTGMVGGVGRSSVTAGPVPACCRGPQRTRRKGCRCLGGSREFLTPLCPLRTGSCGQRRLKVKGWGKNWNFRSAGHWVGA